MGCEGEDRKFSKPRLVKLDYVHSPSRVILVIEHNRGQAMHEFKSNAEARCFFQDGLALCDQIEADYVASLAGTLAAAIDNGITRDEIERGLMRTGFKLTDPNFKQGFQA